MNNELQELIKKKEELGRERDLCAELYNLWITRCHDFQHDKETYDLYVGLINNMEPYANTVKEQVRVINRRICEIEGVESIGDTDYVLDCINPHGMDRPNDSTED